MQNLTPTQINSISKTIEGSGIKFSHLADDLTDHICCEIESLMEKGLGYRRARETVLASIGSKKLKEIQDLTILFTNKTRLVMKKSMYVLSIISVSLALISSVFKFMHLPGASIMFGLAMLCIAFGIIPLMFLSRGYEKNPVDFISLRISGFIAALTLTAEFLFMIMRWPGGRMLFYISTIALIIFIVIYVFVNIKHFKNKAIHLGIAVLLFVYAFVNVVVVTSRLTNIYRFYNYTDLWMKESLDYFNNKKYDGLKTENSLSVIQKTNDLVTYLEELKVLAINSYRQNNLSTSYMFELTKETPGKFEKPDIREPIDGYRLFLLSLNLNSALKQYIEAVLDTKDKKSDGSAPVYQNYIYVNTSKLYTYNNLSRLQKDIRIIESEVLQQLAMQEAKVMAVK